MRWDLSAAPRALALFPSAEPNFSRRLLINHSATRGRGRWLWRGLAKSMASRARAKSHRLYKILCSWCLLYSVSFKAAGLLQSPFGPGGVAAAEPYVRTRLGGERRDSFRASQSIWTRCFVASPYGAASFLFPLPIAHLRHTNRPGDGSFDESEAQMATHRHGTGSELLRERKQEDAIDHWAGQDRAGQAKTRAGERAIGCRD